MAAINKRSERNSVPYDILNILRSVDLFYDKKSKEKIFKEILGAYQAERVITRKEDADVSEIVPDWHPFAGLQMGK
jgi:hypothetical protein